MLLDDLLGLFTLRPRQRPCGFRLAVNEPVLRCFLLGLTPFGLLAPSTQIDDRTHSDARKFTHSPAGRFEISMTQRRTNETVTVLPVLSNTRLFEQSAQTSATLLNCSWITPAGAP